MSIGLVGKKIGMTRVFNEAGVSTPVTVIEATPNRICQVRTVEKDGYHALQVTVGQRRAHRITQPMKGHFAKAEVEPGRSVWEFRLEGPAENEVGSDLTVQMFTEGQKVDVSGRTIGKGFAGTMKRHHFGGGRATHGNSKAHRLPGSIGQNQDPGKVFKGKKMAGSMGNRNRTQQNLDVVRVDSERHLLLVSGSIPGARGSEVVVRPATKARTPAEMA